MVLLGLLALGAVLQLVMGVLVLRALGRVRRLAALDPGAPAVWPRLSVLVPACNEGDTIEAALATLRAETYPNLELVLIDDRSTDETGAVMKRMAAADPRILPIRVDTLPPGWLGKLNAMQRGVEASTGEWLLFTDADVHFAPGALQRAVAHAVSAKLDHLAVLPNITAEGAPLQAAICAFGASYIVSARADDVHREGSKSVAGVGAFNLVRRAALDRTPGLSWLKMEIADDTGLALLLRLYGGRADFVLGERLVWLMWYPTLGAMVRGLEKNAFGILCHWRYWRAPFVTAALVFLTLSPLLAMLQPWSLPVRLIGAAAMISQLAAYGAAGRIAEVSILARLLAPFAGLVIAWALVRSTALCAKNGGALWRGTRYPIEDLRREQRLKVVPFLGHEIPEDLPPPKPIKTTV